MEGGGHGDPQVPKSRLRLRRKQLVTSGKVGGRDGREIEEAGGNLMSEEMVSGVRVEDKKQPQLLR